MKSTVDVWVAATAAAALTPPPRSIVDGASAAVIVRTCVLGRPLQRRIEISLTVDPATADRFSRACRRQMIWKRWVLPIGIVAAVALGVADLVLDSWMPPACYVARYPDRDRRGGPRQAADGVAELSPSSTEAGTRHGAHPRC
nr:hypothetical protein GCM10020092_023670 [Actinoplanes digitatis]